MLFEKLKSKAKEVNVELKAIQSSNKKLSLMQLLEDEKNEPKIAPFEIDERDSIFHSFSLNELEKLPGMV